MFQKVVDRKVTENLREKKLKEFIENENREEQNMLDDVGTSNYIKHLEGGESSAGRY